MPFALPARPFRPAEPADTEAILALMRAHYSGEGYPFAEPAVRRVLTRLIADESLGRIWTIDVEGLIVGYLAVTFGFSLEYLGRDAFVDELFVMEAFRGRGLGSKALALAEDACRTRGVGAVHLQVEPGNEGARRLYGRAGFAEDGRRLMTKRLVSA